MALNCWRSELHPNPGPEESHRFGMRFWRPFRGYLDIQLNFLRPVGCVVSVDYLGHPTQSGKFGAVTFSSKNSSTATWVDYASSAMMKGRRLELHPNPSPNQSHRLQTRFWRPFRANLTILNYFFRTPDRVRRGRGIFIFQELRYGTLD